MAFEDLERELDARLLDQHHNPTIPRLSNFTHHQSSRRSPTDQTLSDDNLNFETEDYDGVQPVRPSTKASQINLNRFSHHDSLSSSPVIALLQRFWRGPLVVRNTPPQFPKLHRFETLPKRLRDRMGAKWSTLATATYLLLWFGLICSLLNPSFSTGPLYEDNKKEVISLSCTGGNYFWEGKNARCGKDGERCLERLFEGEDVEGQEKKEFIVKCPALCDKGWSYSAVPVGTEMIKYRQYVIGGGGGDSHDLDSLTKPYRGDSYPCAAAVHGGVISPFLGGCVKMSFSKDTGIQKFQSSHGNYRTGSSVEFDSFFPVSFVFKSFTSGEVSGCYDLRLVILLLNIIIGLPFTYLTTGLISYWVNTIVGFWTIILVLDPPLTVDASNQESVSQLFSLGFARLLPLLFVLYVIWQTTVKVTLEEEDDTQKEQGTSVVSRCLFWYPLFWIGIANNVTFDRLPIDRLTPHDIKEEPGALLTVSFVFVILIFCGIVQGFQVWKADEHRRYIKLYGTIFLSLSLLALLPGLELRVHHYILGMLLVLGTATKGLSAFVLQGVLVGLMISGIARWDFASIVETHVSLMRGEAGVSLKPPEGLSFHNGELSWVSEPSDEVNVGDLKGFSLLVNDVEVFIGSNSSLSMGSFIESEDYLNKMITNALEKSEAKSVKLFIRLARASLETGQRGDYTRAGILIWPGGDWEDPLDGVS